MNNFMQKKYHLQKNMQTKAKGASSRSPSF